MHISTANDSDFTGSALKVMLSERPAIPARALSAVTAEGWEVLTLLITRAISLSIYNEH
jgi:hypothetical protein